MIVSYSDYLKAKALSDNPEKDLSDDVRAKLGAALAEYEQKYLQGDEPLSPEEGASAINQAAGLPSQEAVSQTLSHASPEYGVAAISDARHPRAPEDLSGNMLTGGFTSPAEMAQPATTHPLGDEAAKQEWLRGDLSNPAGVVVVYDAPLTQVQKDIAEHPELLGALGLSLPPGMPYNIEKGGSIERRYQELKWRQYADAISKKGQTAYRYDAAPWLAEGQNAATLSNLRLKVGMNQGLPQAGQAFILGVDDMGFFGAYGTATKAGLGEGTNREALKAHRAESGPEEMKGVEALNDPSETLTPAELNTEAKREHPVAYTAGQVAAAVPGAIEAGGRLIGKGLTKLGAAGGESVAAVGEGLSQLAEWFPSNALWNRFMGKPATTLAGRVVGNAAKNAAAGAASEGVQAGVEAAGNYVRTGEPGMTGGDVASRMAMGGGTGLVFGGVLGALQHGAAKTNNWIQSETGPYKGLPGTVEQLGSQPRFMRGFSTPPAVEAARAEGRARGVKPIDTIAEKLDEPLATATKGSEASDRRLVRSQNEEVFVSPEGRAPLPVHELSGEALHDLRTSSSPRAGSRKPTVAGLPGADRQPRAVLNLNVDAVSTAPVPGAHRMTPEEAEAFLHPALQEKLVESAQTGKAAKVTPRDRVAIAEDFSDDLPGIVDAEELAAREEGLDLTGYRATPLEQLPSGQSQAIAPVDRYRPGAPQLGQPSALAKVDRYRPPEAPQLETSGTRYSGEPDWRQVPWHEDYDPTPGGPLTRGSREARPGERSGPRPAEARETGPRGSQPTGRRAPGIEAEPTYIPDAEFKERRARSKATKGPQEPRRRRRAEPEVVETTGEPAAAGSTAEELRKAGVTTVYLVPRSYDARRQERVIGLLRTGGGDTTKARRLRDLYLASLRDRDQRTWQGKEKGWSALKAEQEKRLAASKDLTKRVAPKGSAYKATIAHGKHGEGRSQDVAAMQKAAELAGGNAPELERGARIMKPLTELQKISSFGQKTTHGADRLFWGPSAVSDAMMLRGVYPTTRAIERSPTGGAQTLTRLSLAGMHDLRESAERKKKAKGKTPEATPAKKKTRRRRRTPL